MQARTGQEAVSELPPVPPPVHAVSNILPSDGAVSVGSSLRRLRSLFPDESAVFSPSPKQDRKRVRVAYHPSLSCDEMTTGAVQSQSSK